MSRYARGAVFPLETAAERAVAAEAVAVRFRGQADIGRLSLDGIWLEGAITARGLP